MSGRWRHGWRDWYPRSYLRSRYYYYGGGDGGYGGWYPYDSPFWPYWWYPDYTTYYTTVSASEGPVNPVMRADPTQVPDPDEWLRYPNTALHRNSTDPSAPPVFLYCRDGVPTTVPSTAGTASQPLLLVDDQYYQCQQPADGVWY